MTMADLELHEYIKFVKDQIAKSETEKPEKGFWIGAESLEITFQTKTEIGKEGGIKILVLSAGEEKKDEVTQTIKVNFVASNIELRKASIDFLGSSRDR